MKKVIGFLLFTVGLMSLLYLGSWQIQRLSWKKNIIAQLNIEYSQNPLENSFTFTELTALDNQTTPIRYGSVKGTFIHHHTIRLGPKTQDGEIGDHVITPLKMKSGYLLINRGWTAKNSVIEEPKGTIQLKGLIRKPEWNSFTPRNSPENDIWIRPDTKDIAQAKGISPISTVMLYMSEDRWYPRNKHRDYAVFWFTLAVIWSTLWLYIKLFSNKKLKNSSLSSKQS